MEIKLLNIKAGTLKDKIPVSRIQGINSLRLAGALNGDDIEFIRCHTGAYDTADYRTVGPLEVLDLSSCRLTHGGIYKKTEYRGINRDRYSHRQFMELYLNTEFQGPDYGLSLTADDEISDEMFLGCYKLKKIYLPITIKKIGHLAFYQCDNIESIYIGYGLESIGDYAFANNYHLKEIHIKCKTPPKLSEYAFGNPKYQTLPQTNPKNKITLYVPRGCSSEYWQQWGFDNVFEE